MTDAAKSAAKSVGCALFSRSGTDVPRARAVSALLCAALAHALQDAAPLPHEGDTASPAQGGVAGGCSGVGDVARRLQARYAAPSDVDAEIRGGILAGLSVCHALETDPVVLSVLRRGKPAT